MAPSFEDDKKGSSPEEGGRLYNPYQDLNIPYQTLYRLPTSPEFLFQEEAIAQRRSWGGNLNYYTDLAYLCGSGFSAAKGLIEGVRAAEPGDTPEGQPDPQCPRLGILGLVYAGMESGMVAIRDTDDVINSVVAGLGPALSTRRLRGPGRLPWLAPVVG